MRRYLLGILALVYGAWLLWAGWQVTKVEQIRNAAIEYQERGGLSAAEFDAMGEACDEGLDSLQIEAKYFTK